MGFSLSRSGEPQSAYLSKHGRFKSGLIFRKEGGNQAKCQHDRQENLNLVTQAVQWLFPASEAALIKDLIVGDLPYYDASVSPEFVAGMNRFTRDLGIADGQAS